MPSRRREPSHGPIDTAYRVDAAMADALDAMAKHATTCGKCLKADAKRGMFIPCARLQVDALKVARWWSLHKARLEITQPGLFAASAILSAQHTEKESGHGGQTS